MHHALICCTTAEEVTNVEKQLLLNPDLNLTSLEH